MNILDRLKRMHFRSLRTRFVFFFLAVSLIPTIFLGVLTYSTASNLVVDKEVKEAMNRMTIIQDSVNAVLNEKETIAIKFYIDTYVQDLLSRGENVGDNKYQVMKLLFSNEYTDITEATFLGDNYGNIYTNANTLTGDAERMMHKATVALAEADRLYLWLGADTVSGEKVIPFVRTITNLSDHSPIGHVIINPREETLSDIYKANLSEYYGSVFILDGDDNIISSNDKSYLGEGFYQSYGFDGAVAFEDSYARLNVQGEDYLLVQLRDEKNDWTYLYFVESKYILSGLLQIGLDTILICCLSVLISLFFSITISSRITTPINELITTMNQVQAGNLNVYCDVKGEDEVAELGGIYNEMIERLHEYIDEIYDVQKARREAEMKALVFQINPHFLYNTLSSIIWLCNGGRTEEVIEMVSALAKLFRISISRGKEIVQISEEIEHVQSYIRIQQIRFNNRFSYSIDIQDEIVELYTLKVILQPLVENTVNHAITDLDYKGLIQLKGRLKGSCVLLSVTDNGDGMTAAEVDALNEHLRSPGEDSGYGIGTQNVNERIKLRFGPQYGLSYQKEGKYITANIKLPIITDENQFS